MNGHELTDTKCSSMKVEWGFILFYLISLCQVPKPTNGPSEFADMWKELKLKENSTIDSGTDSEGVHSPGENTAEKTGETLIKVCQSIKLCQNV